MVLITNDDRILSVNAAKTVREGINHIPRSFRKFLCSKAAWARMPLSFKHDLWAVWISVGPILFDYVGPWSSPINWWLLMQGDLGWGDTTNQVHGICKLRCGRSPVARLPTTKHHESLCVTAMVFVSHFRYILLPFTCLDMSSNV